MPKSSWPVLLATVLLAVACGPSHQETPGSSELGGGQPLYGGVLNVTVEADPFDWDISYLGKARSCRVLLGAGDAPACLPERR